jgi:hypothetical protein
MGNLSHPLDDIIEDKVQEIKMFSIKDLDDKFHGSLLLIHVI